MMEYPIQKFIEDILKTGQATQLMDKYYEI
jgi:hypothetical protein